MPTIWFNGLFLMLQHREKSGIIFLSHGLIVQTSECSYQWQIIVCRQTWKSMKYLNLYNSCFHCKNSLQFPCYWNHRIMLFLALTILDLLMMLSVKFFSFVCFIRVGSAVFAQDELKGLHNRHKNQSPQMLKISCKRLKL